MPVASCVLTKGSKNEPKDPKGNPVVRPYTPITYDEVNYNSPLNSEDWN